VVGWFQGGSEIGPRALGNRSIIASPRMSWMKDHINHDIKKREWYRPFAPAVIFDNQKEIFDNDYFSPFMLVTALVNEEWRTKIPAVTHIDNSARYQSVTPVSNPRFYQIINKFYEKTGIPVLLNTSFNGPHEPIVETPLDAIKTFESQNLDYLVVGNYIISQPWR
jgi:carbamoyltransferase